MFEDLKVLELASVLAGPLVGTFFSELGASVIKVENKKTNGDVTRRWKLPSEDPSSSVSAYYCAANYSKEVYQLDLNNSQNYEQLVLFIKSADVVIVNYKPGAARRLKVDYDSLKKHTPDVIYASLTGFGENDARPAFDVVLQAETGFMSMNGESGRPPVKMPVALIDILAAHHMKEAILCALIHKMKTGEGKKIDISLYDCALASLANQATNWLIAGHIPQRLGTQHPNIAPYGDMYMTKDERYIVLAIGTDSHFQLLSKFLNIPIKGFEKNVDRVAQRGKLNPLIEKTIQGKNAKYWVTHFSDLNIPFGLVKNVKEVFEDSRAQAQLISEIIDEQNTIRVKTALI